MSDAQFISTALRELSAVPDGARVLDFGCGRGDLVREFRDLGFDAWGCDSGVFRDGDYAPNDRLLEIAANPYRLPFPDNCFDAVVSTSVLEHAQNKEEIFREIFRVLKPGGAMLHLLPSKWYLPVEPHIYVPFVSWMWPRVPYWWLAFWAILGIRNEFQRGLSWRETAKRNRDFCRTGLHYWPASRFRREVHLTFGGCTFLYGYYLKHAPGGAAKLARLMPAKAIVAWILGHTRMTLLFATKTTS